MSDEGCKNCGEHCVDCECDEQHKDSDYLSNLEDAIEKIRCSKSDYEESIRTIDALEIVSSKISHLCNTIKELDQNCTDLRLKYTGLLNSHIDNKIKGYQAAMEEVKISDEGCKPQEPRKLRIYGDNELTYTVTDASGKIFVIAAPEFKQWRNSVDERLEKLELALGKMHRLIWNARKVMYINPSMSLEAIHECILDALEDYDGIEDQSEEKLEKAPHQCYNGYLKQLRCYEDHGKLYLESAHANLTWTVTYCPFCGEKAND